MINHVLITCHANKFRSPLCAGLLAKVDLPSLEIRQGGVNTNNFKDGPAAKKIRDLALPLGVDLSDHRAQAITWDMLDWADLVIYMDGGNLRRLVLMQPEYCKKYQCLAYHSHSSVTRIPDPAFMKRGSLELGATVDLIEEATRNLGTMIALSEGYGQNNKSQHKRVSE